jgi:hypothetical protein
MIAPFSQDPMDAPMTSAGAAHIALADVVAAWFLVIGRHALGRTDGPPTGESPPRRDTSGQPTRSGR